MASFSYFSLFLCFLLLAHFLTLSNAATFEVRNQCPYTVWAAAVPRWWPETRQRPIMDHLRGGRNKTSPYLGTDQLQLRRGRAREVPDR
ncbi:hypothetical protein OIU78_023971 [Salix suchowensis]|nr:hypothetical protein OIU78_023971 [Salix suchowensis]